MFAYGQLRSGCYIVKRGVQSTRTCAVRLNARSRWNYPSTLCLKFFSATWRTEQILATGSAWLKWAADGTSCMPAPSRASGTWLTGQSRPATLIFTRFLGNISYADFVKGTEPNALRLPFRALSAGKRQKMPKYGIIAARGDTSGPHSQRRAEAWKPGEVFLAGQTDRHPAGA